MPLTPYPSLATLSEVIANGGKLPARSIDAFSARTVYASSIPGVVLDCDLDTGLTLASGTPTDNAAAINAVLATATATSPVHLIIDGGSAIGAPILIPPTGYVTITGLGWHTGFHVLPGSNCNAIQSFPHTDYATFYVWAGGSGWATDSSHVHTGVTGENVHLANFRVNGNRGTYPNGNSNGHRDGTVTDSGAIASTPDARGPFAQGYWLSGIILANLDNVTVEKVWVYNAPTYQINVYNSTRVWVHDCRLEVADPTALSNQDGFHVNGGCSDVWFTRSWASVADDPFAFNTSEGNNQPGGNFSVDDLTLVNCLTGGRMHGPGGVGSRVSFRNIRGTTQLRGIVLGDEGVAGAGADSLHSILLENIDLKPSLGTYGDVSMISLCCNAGVVEIRGCKFIEPTIACPMVRVGPTSVTATAPTISSIRISDCEIHRNSVASAAAYLYLQESGNVGDLQVDGFRLTEQYGQTYTDVAALLNLAGGTLGGASLDVSASGAGATLTVASGATCGTVLLKGLRQVSHGGSAHAIVNNSATAFHLHTASALGTGLSALTGGSGTITTTGAGLVAL